VIVENRNIHRQIRTNHNQPLRLLHTIFVLLGIPQYRDVNALGFFNLICCSVADENGLASPFNNDLVLLVLYSL
jgi:hypothetical protein